MNEKNNLPAFLAGHWRLVKVENFEDGQSVVDALADMDESGYNYDIRTIQFRARVEGEQRMIGHVIGRKQLTT